MKLGVRSPTRIPQTYRRVKTPARPSCCLVYYDGSLTSLAALRTACQDALPGTRVVAVYLEMISPSESIMRVDDGAPSVAQAVIAAALVNAAMYGVKIETLCQQCHARGPAMVELAERYGNATIYLGVVEGVEDPFADYLQALAPSSVILIS